MFDFCFIPLWQVPAGSSHVVQALFSGRIFDQPPPNAPGPFEGTAIVASRIELLGRPFERVSKHLIMKFPYIAYSSTAYYNYACALFDRLRSV